MPLKRPLVVLGALSVVAGSIAFSWWWVERRDRAAAAAEEATFVEPDQRPAGKDPAAAAAGPAGGTLPSAGGEQQPPPPAATAPPAAQRLAEVQAIIEGEGANAAKLIKAYADWSTEPTALEARRAALTALATQGPPLVRLSGLMNAVGSASVAPERDPLFADAVKAATSVWSPENIQSGRDMMLAETDPHARQLLVSSLAQYATTDKAVAELTPSQKIGLRSDFIDIYHDQPQAQQHDMEAAVRAIAGEHAAELLRGLATTR